MAAETLIKDIVEHTPSIVSGWWRKFHYVAANWVAAGLLTTYITGFAELLELCGRKGRTRRTPPEPELTEQLCMTKETHEFLLFSWIFLDYNKNSSNGANIRIAIAATTTTEIAPAFNLHTMFPTVRRQLTIQPSALSSRLQEVLERTDDSQTYKLVINAITWLSHYFLYSLSGENMPEMIVSSYWRLFAASPRGPEKDTTTYNAVVLVSMLADEGILTSDQRLSAPVRLPRLLGEYDLLCLVEKGIIIRATSLEDHPLVVWERVRILLVQDPAALRPPLRRDFLHMLDYLRAIKNPRGEYFLDFWLKLGTAAGVSEKDLREEQNQERKSSRRGLVGCSWYKCAMYEQESVKDTFFCAGCEKVMY
ncbi:hypothetical protein FRB97_008486, partial [Tulasnella sp. 331]